MNVISSARDFGECSSQLADLGIRNDKQSQKVDDTGHKKCYYEFVDAVPLRRKQKKL